MTESGRIRSIDVLRGLTVAGMLLVNNPGDGSHVFAALRHSPWNGCTFADVIFPTFLFLVGVTTEFTAGKASTGTTLRRAGILFALGVLLNAYPFFEKNAVAGPTWLPTAIGHIVARLTDLRFFGVLQRIALAFLAAAFIARGRPTRAVIALTVLLLVGYWVLLALVPVDAGLALPASRFAAPDRTLPVLVDHGLLDWERWGLGWHLWDRAVVYEPEGVLSTIPAVASVLSGVLAARWLRHTPDQSRRINGLVVAGIVAVIAGLLWSTVFPINKPIWSSSFVLFTSGVAAIALAACMWVVDGWSARGLTPFLVLGSNAIVAYVGSELLGNVMRSGVRWRVGDARLGSGMALVRVLQNLGVDATLASGLYAALFTGLCVLLLLPLYRRGRFIRI